MTRWRRKRTKRVVASKGVRAPRSTVGASILVGLRQAVAWTEGKNSDVRVTIPAAPEVDVRAVRRGKGL